MDKDIHFRSQVSLDNSFSQPTNYTHCKLRPGREPTVLSLGKSTIHCLLIGQLSLRLREPRDGFNNQVTGCGEAKGWLRCQYQGLLLVKFQWKASDWSVSSHISIPCHQVFIKKCPSQDWMYLDIRPVTNVGLDLAPAPTNGS